MGERLMVRDLRPGQLWRSPQGDEVVVDSVFFDGGAGAGRPVVQLFNPDGSFYANAQARWFVCKGTLLREAQPSDEERLTRYS